MTRDSSANLDATLDPSQLDTRWQQLLAMSADTRESWLMTIEEGDPHLAQSLRARMHALSSATQAGETESFAESDATPMPRRFGNFVLIKRIGVGGMGEVWLADQDHPRRQIALKLIRGGLAGDDALRRFQREATLASRAEHPSIARVYEAGNVQTAQGAIPYLAMEYVVGQGLREYLQARPVSVRDRLGLIAVIAEAVHHAHVRGVVHRDLKPQNILVGADGVPKILDFGVARALEDSTPGATRMTMAGQLVGTLAYMSPEQLAGDMLAIDARSDVYALGVIAYEILAGDAPFKISDTSILEAIQARARQRPEALGKRHRHLRGDIELIVMKALADEPDRRYQTAHELAEDIERFLHAQPIKARAPTRAYLWGRFVRRNRIGVSAAALVLTAVIVGAIVSLRFAYAEADARREAELRTAKAEAVTNFLYEMLANADPTNARGRDLKLTEVLTSAAQTLDVSPPKEAQVEAGIREILVEIFRNLGDFEAALVQVAAGQDAARRGYAENAPEVLRLDTTEAGVLLDLERTDAAEAQISDIQSRIRGQHTPPEIKLAVATQSVRADIVRGDFEKALGTIDRALSESTLPRTHPVAYIAHTNRVVALTDLGRFDEARSELAGLIDDKTRALGADHPSVMRLRAEVAVIYDSEGKGAAAEKILREVMASETRVFGPDNVETVATSMNLIKVLIDRHAFDEAEPMLDHAIRVQTTLFGQDHERVRLARNMRAVLHEERGRPEAAEAEYQAIIEGYGRTGGVDHPEALVARNNLAKLYLTQKRFPAAVAAYGQIVEDAEKKLGKSHYYTAIFLGNQGDALRQAGDPRALSVLEDAYGRCAKALGESHERTRRIAQWLADAASDRGDAAMVTRWQARAAITESQ